MRDHGFLRTCLMIVLVTGLLCISGDAFASALNTQEKKPSEAEVQAAKKLTEAKGPEARLQLASDFVKKYPKSGLRQKIADAVATEIAGIQDRALKVSAAQTYTEIFTEPAEADSFQPILIEAYLDNNQVEEAFRASDPWLGKHPDELMILLRLALIGSADASRGSTKFLEKAQQYGMKAIELMETDKRPAAIEVAQWAPYKAKWLPVIYREMGVIAVRASKPADAKARLEKAIVYKSTDPTVYAIFGGLEDDEYEALAVKYKSAPAGAEADAVLKKAQDQLDKVLELYAHAIALAEGKPEYKLVIDQLTPSLEGYFKFRHKGSTDGLRQLIDKYKTPAATP